MKSIDTSRLRSTVFRISHATGIYFIFYMLRLHCSMNLRSKFFVANVQYFWDDALYCKVGAVFSLVLFFSLISIFTLNDYTYKKRFIEGNNSDIGFAKKCRFVVTDRAFIIEAATICFWVAVLPMRILWFDVLRGFYDSYIMLAIILPIMAALIFLSHLATVNWWQRISRKKGFSFSQKESLINLLKQFVVTAVLYSIAAFALSIVFPMITTVWNVAKYLGLALIVGIVLLLIYINGYKTVRLIASRKKLLKGLKRLVKAGQCSVKSIENPYSATKNSIITIEKDGAVYSCKLMCAPKQKIPLRFHDDGNMRYTKVYTFLGVVDLFFHEATQPYFFDGEGKKIIIIAPETIRAVSTDGHTERKIIIGDVIMGYTFYDAGSFLNAIDRNCL